MLLASKYRICLSVMPPLKEGSLRAPGCKMLIQSEGVTPSGHCTGLGDGGFCVWEP